MNQTYQVVTVCDRIPQEPYYCLPQFMASLGDHKPLVLNNENMGSRFTGLGTKPKWLYRAIKTKMIATDYIVFCDCFDLVFATSVRELMLKYFQFSAPLVISAERNCFPDDLKAEYDKLIMPTVPSTYHYLNSGMIVGETEAILGALEAMGLANIPDDYYNAERGCNVHINDQLLWMQQYLKQPVPMVMDTFQILCNTLHSVKLEDLDFNGSRIFNKETHTFPCSFHLNGSAKTDGLREPILKHLGL